MAADHDPLHQLNKLVCSSAQNGPTYMPSRNRSLGELPLVPGRHACDCPCMTSGSGRIASASTGGELSVPT